MVLAPRSDQGLHETEQNDRGNRQNHRQAGQNQQDAARQDARFR
jgi:hypothetical protein